MQLFGIVAGSRARLVAKHPIQLLNHRPRAKLREREASEVLLSPEGLLVVRDKVGEGGHNGDGSARRIWLSAGTLPVTR